jgi:hypothetical protein
VDRAHAIVRPRLMMASAGSRARSPADRDGLAGEIGMAHLTAQRARETIILDLAGHVTPQGVSLGAGASDRERG